MACKILYDPETGQPIGIACGSPWGIGVYVYDEETGESIYGFPPDGMNPELFYPDVESCSPKELAAYQEALKAWREAKSQETP